MLQVLEMTEISPVPRDTPSALGEKPRLCWELQIKEKTGTGQRAEIYKQYISFFYFHFKYRAFLYNQGIPSPSLPLSKEILHWKINTRSGSWAGRASLASATSMGQKSLDRDLSHFKSFLKTLGKTSWCPS